MHVIFVCFFGHVSTLHSWFSIAPHHLSVLSLPLVLSWVWPFYFGFDNRCVFVCVCVCVVPCVFLLFPFQLSATTSPAATAVETVAASLRPLLCLDQTLDQHQALAQDRTPGQSLARVTATTTTRTVGTVVLRFSRWTRRCPRPTPRPSRFRVRQLAAAPPTPTPTPIPMAVELQ